MLGEGVRLSKGVMVLPSDKDQSFKQTSRKSNTPYMMLIAMVVVVRGGHWSAQAHPNPNPLES